MDGYILYWVTILCGGGTRGGAAGGGELARTDADTGTEWT